MKPKIKKGWVMKAHWQYLLYVLRHKWLVFLECAKRGHICRGLTHDLSKFRPDEWFAYVDHFYGRKLPCDPAFERAHELHITRNYHHWQRWVTTFPENVLKPIILEMDPVDRWEMLCDWIALEKSKGQKTVKAWYTEHQDEIILHPLTKAWLEAEIARLTL